MAKRREDKTRAGQHRGLVRTEKLVHVQATERMPAYDAHVYTCPCGASDTRRELKKTPCPIAQRKRAAEQAGRLVRVNPEQ